MKKKLTILAVLTVGLAALCLAAAPPDTGLWSRSPRAGFPNVRVCFDDGTGEAPVETQPDGGVISDTVSVVDAGAGWYAYSGYFKSGLNLAGLKSFSVKLVNNTSDAGTFTAGTLLAYVYNPADAGWSRAPDLDLTVAALGAETWLGFTVQAGQGRITYVPSGLTNPVCVWLTGSN